jgi:hypothetical protein
MSQLEPIHIKQSSSGAVPDYKADGLVIENGGNVRFETGLSILSNEVSNGNVFFGDRLNPKAGQIKYNHYVDKMFFYTSGSKRVTLSDTGLAVDRHLSCKSLTVEANTNFGAAVYFNGKMTFNTSSQRPEDEMIKLNVPSNTIKNVLTVTENSVVHGGIHFTYGDYGNPSIISLTQKRFGVKLKSTSATNFAFEPCAVDGGNKDNSVDLGRSNNRFDDVYATNGSIQTSDRNEKQDIQELSEAEQRVAVVAKGLLRKFKWKESVVEKGVDARTHFGIIAQDLQDAFEAEGLDAGDYGMFTSNTWWAHRGTIYEVEDNAPEGATKHTRLGVRYSELLAFIIATI